MQEQNKSKILSWEEWVEWLIQQPEEEQLTILLEKAKEQYNEIQRLLSEKQGLQQMLQEQTRLLQSQTDQDNILAEIHRQKEELVIRYDELERREQLLVVKQEEIKKKRTTKKKNHLLKTLKEYKKE